MKAWFNKQSRVVQLILLLIPFVNWVVELCVRWPDFLEKKDPIKLVVAIIATFGGFVLGWVDLVWCLVYKHLILAA